MDKNFEQFEKSIGYTFKNKELLKNALTHTSYAYENKIKSNERLEYLGDSILEFISSEYLFLNYNNLSEGEMTKARAFAVCEEALAEVANSYGFGDFLRVGKCENKVNGRYRNSILADSVEAVIGAIYMDSGIEAARKFIIADIERKLKEYVEVGNKDYKTQLQEILQVNGDVLIEYKIVREDGPEHAKIFTAEVYCNGKLLGTGKGKNKKESEMDAARLAIKNIK